MQVIQSHGFNKNTYNKICSGKKISLPYRQPLLTVDYSSKCILCIYKQIQICTQKRDLLIPIIS